MTSISSTAGARATGYPLVKSAASPVVMWASFGMLTFLYSLYVWGSWIMSPDFKMTVTGVDAAPDWHITTVFYMQIVITGAGLLALGWAIRNWRKTGHLTALGMLPFIWLLVYWQDPIGDSVRMWFGYSSYLFNYGSWANSFFFWIQPNAELLPEPLLFDPGGYVLLGVGGSLFAFWVMRKAKDIWPQIGTLGLISAGLSAGIMLDFVLEVTWVRTGMYQFVSTIDAFTLFAGETYQFPLYESLIFGPAMCATGILYYFRDDKGFTSIERGAEKIRNHSKQTWFRFFALLGFVNVCFLIYNVLIVFSTLYVDSTPDYPSWMINGMCGEGTEYYCPSTEHPIPLPASGPQKLP